MRKKIGELLLESGAVNPEQIRTALGQQRTRGHSQRLGSVIVTLGFTSSIEVARALARQSNLPFVQLPEEIPPDVRALVPLDFQVEHRIVPFLLEREGRSERMHVAVDDPSDLTLVDELSFQLNRPIRVHVASEDDLDRALDLVTGRVVDGMALDDAEEPMELERGYERPAAPPSHIPLLDWDLPGTHPGTSPDSAHLPATRSEVKPKPPAPPPFADDEEEITLITPKNPQKTRGAGATPPPPPVLQENVEVLDELLGEPEDEQTPLPAPPGPGAKKGVPVVVFGGAAKGSPQPTPRPELPDISDEDLKVLEDIERMADGAEAELHTEKVKPARMVASLIRLLIRKRLIREEEFLEELSRK